MIYDSLLNIGLYKGISEDLYLGLEFIKKTSHDIENGVYQLNSHVKAIVSEYETKDVNENGYEAHKKFIDIQYLLKGEERIACLPIELLDEIKPYKEEIDAAFYNAKKTLNPIYLGIQPGYFAVFYPQDGHTPCLSINKPQNVKKVVVKVEVR